MRWKVGDFMSERKVKCPACGTMNVKSEAVEHNKRYYCPACFEAKNKPKPKNDWDYLYETIVKYYGNVTPVMFKQLKDYRELPQYRFTDIGMKLTLIYCHEILAKPVTDKHQLGVIPYYYDKAKAHYSEIYRIENVAKSFVSNETTEIVKVSHKTEIECKPFDFDEISWEEE